jgi:hypothetical protein
MSILTFFFEVCGPHVVEHHPLPYTLGGSNETFMGVGILDRHIAIGAKFQL